MVHSKAFAETVLKRSYYYNSHYMICRYDHELKKIVDCTHDVPRLGLRYQYGSTNYQNRDSHRLHTITFDGFSDFSAVESNRMSFIAVKIGFGSGLVERRNSIVQYEAYLFNISVGEKQWSTLYSFEALDVRFFGGASEEKFLQELESKVTKALLFSVDYKSRKNLESFLKGFDLDLQFEGGRSKLMVESKKPDIGFYYRTNGRLGYLSTIFFEDNVSLGPTVGIEHEQGVGSFRETSYDFGFRVTLQDKVDIEVRKVWNYFRDSEHDGDEFDRDDRGYQIAVDFDF